MSAHSLVAAAFLFVTVGFSDNVRAHWSGIDLCDEVDGIDYLAAKKILHDKQWAPDIPKLSAHSDLTQNPELSCIKGDATSCEITFRHGKGFIVLVVKKYAPDEFAVEKCY